MRVSGKAFSFFACIALASAGCASSDGEAEVATSSAAVEGGFVITNAADVDRLAALLDDLGVKVASTAHEAKLVAMDYENAANACAIMKEKLAKEGLGRACSAEYLKLLDKAFHLYHNTLTAKLTLANIASADYHDAAEKIAKALASVGDDGLRATAQTRFASIALYHGAKTVGAWSRVSTSRVANLGVKAIFGALAVGACTAAGAVADVLLNPNVCQGGERPNPTDELCNSWILEYLNIQREAIQRYGLELQPPAFPNQQDDYRELMWKLSRAEEKYNACKSDTVGPFRDEPTYDPEWMQLTLEPGETCGAGKEPEYDEP